tara:strand:- start:665 stop:967 length:303 start_codon:yes stop_codon:yes gene_type:complete
MSNSSFKNLQNQIQKLKDKLEPNEPDRRAQAIEYLDILCNLVNESYIKESPSDYMFIKTLTDSVKEVKYFGGFTNQAKERLLIIEDRYNYIHDAEKDKSE